MKGRAKSTKTITKSESERALLETQLNALSTYEQLVSAVNENHDRISQLKQDNRKIPIEATETNDERMQTEVDSDQNRPAGMNPVERLQCAYHAAQREYERGNTNRDRPNVSRQRKSRPKQLEFLQTIAEAANENSPLMAQFVPCFAPYDDADDLNSSVNLTWDDQDAGPPSCTEELQWILGLAEKQIDSLQTEKETLKKTLLEKDIDIKKMRESLRQKDYTNAKCKAVCDHQRSRIVALQKEKQELVNSLSTTRKSIAEKARTIHQSASEETILAGNTGKMKHESKAVCFLESKIQMLKQDKKLAVRAESEASLKCNHLEKLKCELTGQVQDQQTRIDALKKENMLLAKRLEDKEAEVARLQQLVEDKTQDLKQCSGLCVFHEDEANGLKKKLAASEQQTIRAAQCAKDVNAGLHSDHRKDDLLKAELRIQKLRLLLSLVESHQSSRMVCSRCNGSVGDDKSIGKVIASQTREDMKDSRSTTFWLKKARNAIEASNSSRIAQSAVGMDASLNESLTKSNTARMPELMALLESHGTFIRYNDKPATRRLTVMHSRKKYEEEFGSDTEPFHSFDIE